jgi:hypothetical protein
MREVGAQSTTSRLKFAKEMNKSINPPRRRRDYAASARLGLQNSFDERIPRRPNGEVGWKYRRSDVAGSRRRRVQHRHCGVFAPRHSWQFTAREA